MAGAFLFAHLCYNHPRMITLTAAKLATLARALAPWHTLDVQPDGVVYLVRAYKVTTLVDLEEACGHWQPGDTLTVERYPDNWRVVLKRPAS